MADVIPYNPNKQQVMDWVSQSRAAGYTQDDINKSMSEWVGQAQAAGYSQDDINKAMGFDDGSAVEAAMHREVKTSALAVAAGTSETAAGAKDKATTSTDSSPMGVFANHIRNSSSGLLVNNSYETPAVDPEHEDWLQHIAGVAGDLVGDAPAMLAGAAGGSAAGGPIGAGAGAFALPTAIRSMYADAFMNGEVKGPEDFIARYSKVLLETGKAAVAGAALGGVSKIAGVAGLSSFDATLAQVATLSVVPAALNGKLPAPEDVIDASVILLGFKAVSSTPENLGLAREAIVRLWRDTGIAPQEAMQRMQSDEGFRQTVVQMMAETGEKFIKDESGAITPPAPAPAAVTAANTPEERVDAMFAEPVTPDHVKADLEGGRFYHEWFNAESDMGRAMAKARSGGTITDADNPQMLMRAAANSETHARFALEEGQITLDKSSMEWTETGGKSFTDILKPFSKEPAPMWRFVAAKWAQERHAQGLEPGIDLADADHIANDPANIRKYGQAQKELVAFQNGTLDVLRESGFMTDETYQKIADENKARIPGMRVGKTDIVSGNGPKVWNPVKSAKGSVLQVRNTMQTIMQETFLRYKLAEKNLAKRAMYKVSAGIMEAEPVAPRTIRVQLTGEELARLQSDLLNDPNFDMDSAAIWRRHTGEALQPNEDAFFEDGKLKKVSYRDERLAQYMKGLDRPTTHWWGDLGAKFHGFLRSTIVNMPTFPLRMAIWDKQLQFLVDPEWRLGGAGFFEGLFHTVAKDDTYKKFQLSGGFGKLFDNLDRDKYIQNKIKDLTDDPSVGRRVWNRINPLSALKWFGNSVMRVQQVGRFARETKSGAGNLAAGQAAAEAAFPRAGGGGTVARVLDRNIIFMNAYLQSLEVMARGALGKHVGGKLLGGNVTVKGVSYNAAKFFTAGFVSITIPTLYQWWQSKDTNWYKDLHQWEKDNSYVAHIGPDDGTGATFSLHTLPVASFLFGALPLRLVTMLDEQNPGKFWEDMGKSMGWSFVPPGYALVSNFFSPLISKPLNRDVSNNGAPIVPDWMRDGLLPPEQFTPYASEFAKFAAGVMWQVPVVKGLRMNPNEIDMFIRAWTGPMGSQLERGAEAILRSQGSIGQDLASMTWSDLPGASSFLSRFPEASSAPVDRFEGAMSEYTRQFGSIKAAMVAGDFARFKQLVDENPTFAVMTRIDLGMVGGAVFNGNPDYDKYVDVISAAGDRADQDAGQAILEAKKTLENNRVVAKLIEQTETPEIRDLIEGSFDGGTGKSTDQPFTADDKRQILDHIYIGMMNTADQANRAIRQTEIHP